LNFAVAQSARCRVALKAPRQGGAAQRGCVGVGYGREQAGRVWRANPPFPADVSLPEQQVTRVVVGDLSPERVHLRTCGGSEGAVLWRTSAPAKSVAGQATVVPTE